jgi:hypothetical protein
VDGVTLQVVEAELRGYRPGNDATPPESTSFEFAFGAAFGAQDASNYRIKGTRLEGPLVQGRRLDGLIDDGSLEVNNNRGVATGVYGGGAYGAGIYSDVIDIVDGDRVGFWAQLEGESAPRHRWTALVRYDRFELSERERSTAYYTLDDFVFGVCNWREVRDAFEGVPIAESLADGDDGILNRILKAEAPEIDRSRIATFRATTDISWTGASLLDAVSELAQRAGAVLASDGTSLVFQRLADVETEWTLQPGDYGTLSNRRNTSGLATEIRVDGGEQPAPGSEQTTQSDTTTVTADSRLTHQITVRKSEVARINLWTAPSGSGETMSVRLQADDGGTPIAPGTKESDIARRVLASEFLEQGGYTTFLIPEHTLPDREPWLIAETSGTTGHDVGTDGSGTPTYQVKYPFPLNTRVSDADAADTYRRRVHSEVDEEMTTRRDTADRAAALRRRRSQPTSRVKFRAHSRRAHALAPGDLIHIDEPVVKAQGDYLIMETRDTYDPSTNRLETDLTARDVTTL